MGDSFHDPVDHMRTTRPFAGESLIDVVSWPGYVLVVAGVIAFAGSLAAFASGHHSQGMTSGTIAIIAAVLGLVWVAVEHRRVRRIADRWYDEHPEAYRHRPAS